MELQHRVSPSNQLCYTRNGGGFMQTYKFFTANRPKDKVCDLHWWWWCEFWQFYKISLQSKSFYHLPLLGRDYLWTQPQAPLPPQISKAMSSLDEWIIPGSKTQQVPIFWWDLSKLWVYRPCAHKVPDSAVFKTRELKRQRKNQRKQAKKSFLGKC